MQRANSIDGYGAGKQTKPKHNNEQQLLPPWEVQRADHWNREDKEDEICRDVDARHDVPNRLEVHAASGDRRVPEGGDGRADEGQHDGEGEAPCAKGEEDAEGDVAEDGLEEEAAVLQDDGDFGKGDGDVVGDDGAVEGFHVGREVLRGHGPYVAAEAPLSFCWG